ncbi:MAG: dihydrolipoyl dehydrogenase [Desulfobacterales bacterium]|jgi:mercury(II) reductase|nr:dihydrolipoyl dehydrogenase [Desulfobacteraceae bacterium]MBT4363726.1 dihydrolipoyl dehydrogenase [Desulfobacteraceae bacterium]MBT7086473.1 dihydrolipoyl dehydrogenase [Desulfobacterales bacterium]MBT7695873.1 dihydrolipoyl dehydrogenase [Desulfobacterales bacterium]
MKKNRSGLPVFLFILILVILFFVFDLDRFLTLEYLKSSKDSFNNYYEAHGTLTILIYMVIYIAVTALSLPGAAVMSLAGGALFGLLKGTIVVSFASSIGATIAFLVSRFLLKNYVQEKFGDKLETINNGIKKDGAFYLFTLRLVPVFPFFVINLAMGFTPIRTGVFYIVSQIGMLPGTIVFINAGTQLGNIESTSGILTPGLLFSFALLGVFPLIAKKAVSFFKTRRIISKYPRPKKYDYNIAVIGAGSAGLVSSYIAATVRAKVVLIEKNKMGGDCLNTGCVPSKALIRSAKILSYAKRAEEFGFKTANIDFDFNDIMERVQSVIKKVEPHDSIERYTELGVECIEGEAKISSPYTIEVNGNSITAKNIIIASGGSPYVPPIPGLEKTGYLTSDTVWDIRKLPERMIVIGGGPIGCELAQAFSRLGSKITQVQRSERIMVKEDSEISDFVKNKFLSEGINVLTEHKTKEVIVKDGKKILICDNNGDEIYVEFDEILVAVGRKANTSGFGLEELGVRITNRGTIETNELLQTNFPNIYCAGDVAGPYQFTHTASHQAWYASVNAMFGNLKSFKVDYRVIPWCTFTDPEVARVGLNEKEAKAAGIDYEVTTYGIDDLDRAIADSEDHGLIKILTKQGSDKILGVTIVGSHAGDLISEYILAMKHGLGLNKILGTIHIYPTLAEANKFAAGEWKKAHAPEKVLKWLEKFHTWMRG